MGNCVSGAVAGGGLDIEVPPKALDKRLQEAKERRSALVAELTKKPSWKKDIILAGVIHRNKMERQCEEAMARLTELSSQLQTHPELALTSEYWTAMSKATDAIEKFVQAEEKLESLKNAVRRLEIERRHG